MSIRRFVAGALLGVTALLAVVGAAQAQQDITRIIVPFPAGGGTDVYVRLLASEMVGTGPTAGFSTPKTETIVPQWTYAGMEAGIRDVIVGMETGRPTAGPVEHAWRSAAILDAVLRSAADGNRPAKIDAPSWSQAGAGR